MGMSIEHAVLIAIARDGTLSLVEKQGFTSAQIAETIRKLLREGYLIRKEARFVLGPNVALPTIVRTELNLLAPLVEYAIDKLDENQCIKCSVAR